MLHRQTGRRSNSDGVNSRASEYRTRILPQARRSSIQYSTTVYHVLTVGEIYDKAIDLCLRNAWRIAIILGVYFLVFDTIVVLNSTYTNSGLLAGMHMHPRDAIMRGTWITILFNVVHYTVLPILVGALFVLFDSSLRRQSVILQVGFQLPPRRIANVIVA